MNFLLFILSLVLGTILFPIGFIFAIFKALYKNIFFKEGLPNVNKKFLRLATALDIYGNVVCAELFNATLITKDSQHLFGNYGETISQCIGHNLVNKTLSRTGRGVNSALNFFDKNHSLKAIKQI